MLLVSSFIFINLHIVGIMHFSDSLARYVILRVEIFKNAKVMTLFQIQMIISSLLCDIKNKSLNNFLKLNN